MECICAVPLPLHCLPVWLSASTQSHFLYIVCPCDWVYFAQSHFVYIICPHDRVRPHSPFSSTLSVCVTECIYTVPFPQYCLSLWLSASAQFRFLYNVCPCDWAHLHSSISAVLSVRVTECICTVSFPLYHLSMWPSASALSNFFYIACLGDCIGTVPFPLYCLGDWVHLHSPISPISSVPLANLWIHYSSPFS